MYQVTVVNQLGLSHTTNHDTYRSAIRDYEGACDDSSVRSVEIRMGEYLVARHTNRSAA